MDDDNQQYMPVIYQLPSINKIIVENENVRHHINAAPGLLKYGYNYIDSDMDLMSFSSNSNYKSALDISYDRVDENSIEYVINNTFGLSDPSVTDMELWEIFSLFDLVKKGCKISCQIAPDVDKLVESYSKYHHIDDVKYIPESNKVNLAIFATTHIAVDESAHTQLILSLISKSNLEKNGSMIVQLFGPSTAPTVQLAAFLTGYFDFAYVIKPTITSEIAQYIYLVLIKSKEPLPSLPSNLLHVPNYISDIGINVPAPIDSVFVCLISQLITKRHARYNTIKSFLSSKLYEGDAYDEYKSFQDKLVEYWKQTHLDLSKAKAELDRSVSQKQDACSVYNDIYKILDDF